MNDDDPLDLGQVAADAESVERLRARCVADRDDDVALALLRELVDDVEADLSPSRTPIGMTIVSIAGDDRPGRRLVRSGTVVSVLAAGLVTLGGVAAASTLVPVGTPLHALGSAVRSATGAVVDAVTPPDTPAAPARPAGAGTPVDRPVERRVERPVVPSAGAAQRPATPGADVAAAERSRAAARQVTALLGAASSLLDRGRTDAAQSRLDTAERRLADVLPAEHGPLADRLAALRARIAETRSAPSVQPAAKPRPKAPTTQERKKQPAPARKPAAEREGARSERAPKASKGSAPDLAPLAPGDAADAAPARARRR